MRITTQEGLPASKAPVLLAVSRLPVVAAPADEVLPVALGILPVSIV